MRKSLPPRPENLIENFLRDHEEEFELEEMSICKLAQKEGDSDFISKINEIIQNHVSDGLVDVRNLHINTNKFYT